MLAREFNGLADTLLGAGLCTMSERTYGEERIDVGAGDAGADALDAAGEVLLDIVPTEKKVNDGMRMIAYEWWGSLDGHVPQLANIPKARQMCTETQVQNRAMEALRR